MLSHLMVHSISSLPFNTQQIIIHHCVIATQLVTRLSKFRKWKYFHEKIFENIFFLFWKLYVSNLASHHLYPYDCAKHFWMNRSFIVFHYEHWNIYKASWRAARNLFLVNIRKKIWCFLLFLIQLVCASTQKKIESRKKRRNSYILSKRSIKNNYN